MAPSSSRSGKVTVGYEDRQGAGGTDGAVGRSGTSALVDMLDANNRECAEHVMTLCGERFERRLVEETSKLRVEMAQQGAALRTEIAQLGGGLRQEMAQLGGNLRQEMAQLGGDLRQEMAQLGSGLRQEMARQRVDLRDEIATGRVELLKWAFVFWVGQLVSVSVVVGLLIRSAR